MPKMGVIAAAGNALADALAKAIESVDSNRVLIRLSPASVVTEIPTMDAMVYVPSCNDRERVLPNLREAEDVLRAATTSTAGKFVFVSSALIYGIGPGRQLFVDESYSAPAFRGEIAERWQCLEAQAQQHLTKKVLVILRPVLVSESAMLPAQRVSQRFSLTLPGHDPVLQVLAIGDLAQAVLCAAESDKPGIYNVAPDRVLSLKKALRYAGAISVPVPRTMQRLIANSEALDHIRYSSTVANEKIKRDVGFTPRRSSLAALAEYRNRVDRIRDPEPVFDDFGLDPTYIRRRSNTIFRFLRKLYWRIEEQGIEHIPCTGRAILVGTHRGFVPLDGAMAVDTILRHTGRVPRFLTHPMLFKFPFLFDFMTKMGGVPACRESAARVLESDGLLGVFPEGVNGAFTLYRDAYKVQGFGRDAFVKIALQHRAPIIPFVTVGSAEIFPVFARIRFPWFKRYAGFPFIPITPTFPLLPVPLPSKWHTQFLAPVEVSEYPPEAANDPGIVKAISRKVRSGMQQALDQMRARRKSIFFGSIFEPAAAESRGKTAPI